MTDGSEGWIEGWSIGYGADGRPEMDISEWGYARVALDGVRAVTSVTGNVVSVEVCTGGESVVVTVDGRQVWPPVG